MPCSCDSRITKTSVEFLDGQFHIKYEFEDLYDLQSYFLTEDTLENICLPGTKFCPYEHFDSETL